MEIRINGVNEGNVVHLKDLAPELRAEALAQILYEGVTANITAGECSEQGLYTQLHCINLQKYVNGVIDNDINAISLLAKEISNSCYANGIAHIDCDVVTRILKR